MAKGEQDTIVFLPLPSGFWQLGSISEDSSSSVPPLHPVLHAEWWGGWQDVLCRVRLRSLSLLFCRLCLINFTEPVGLNFSMFIPTLENLGTTAQQEKWLPPAEELAVVGTYAQTELGHG